MRTNNQESMPFLGKNRGSNYAGKSGSYNGSYNGGSNMQGYGVNGSNGRYGRNLASKRPPLFCDHCKMFSDTVKKCYKIRGYPPGHRLYKNKRVAPSVTQEQDGAS